ncbi:hypothetical protein [Desulfuribacillus alkaliarsenatis]|uniref:Appr-1-p processing protein n=1 Tax=Desulfuribacillus alkaliarsenatis TaxID=766136 RepID=A0A1E5G169_9FIRM|nr:hypothetical protein [Desulfuribacillus alkaliarsenatis]OEF96570.1 hypothetical protein BHF68_07955 [Desulfuribacillus alkaliarsenatis]
MLTEKLLKELQEYVEKGLQKSICVYKSPIIIEADYCLSESIAPYELEGFIRDHQKPSFREVLFTLIDKKELKDAEVYKKAEIDRRHFSKIRSKADYLPKKHTVIALAFALTLNVKQAEQLLCAAGYSLSEHETFDLVIRFCLEKKIHDIDDVNSALHYFSLQPLF